MKYERLTKETVGSFGYDLKDFEHKPKEFNDYDAFYAYKMAVKRLAELEDKIESGELCDRKETAREILDEVSRHYGGRQLVDLYKKYGLIQDEKVTKNNSIGRKATEKMLNYAKDISECVIEPLPKTDDFYIIYNYISRNKNAYQMQMEERQLDYEAELEIIDSRRDW